MIARKIKNGRRMKKINFVLSLSFMMSISILASKADAQPKHLKFMKNWDFKRLELPLDFSPKLNRIFSGRKCFIEYLYPPGAYNKKSKNYMSYIFVVSCHSGKRAFSLSTERFLTTYFQEFCLADAEEKGSQIDISKIKTGKINTLWDNKPEKPEKPITDKTEMMIFDCHNGGECVRVNVELQIMMGKTWYNALVVVMLSPEAEASDIWKKLIEIRNAVKL